MPGEGRRFKKGDVPNPNGPGKESNRTGRYSKACVYVAQKSALGILTRQIKIALGKAVEQIGPSGEAGILVSAKIADQTKSAEFVFKVAKLLTNEPEKTPADSVKNVEAAMAVLRLIEGAGRNANNPRGAGSDPAGLGDGTPGVQAAGASA